MCEIGGFDVGKDGHFVFKGLAFVFINTTNGGKIFFVGGSNGRRWIADPGIEGWRSVCGG
jgi:hypothetical protein